MTNVELNLLPEKEDLSQKSSQIMTFANAASNSRIKRNFFNFVTMSTKISNISSSPAIIVEFSLFGAYVSNVLHVKTLIYAKVPYKII